MQGYIDVFNRLLDNVDLLERGGSLRGEGIDGHDADEQETPYPDALLSAAVCSGGATLR